MSDATILRFPRRDRERPSRSGRFSTRSIYRGTRAEGEADTGSGEKPTLRLVPEIATDRPGMATDYSCRLGKGEIARIRLSDDGPRRQVIDWVFVPPAHRASGVGRQLMRRVVADADRLGVTLSLEARACAGLEQGQLEAWYGRFGFVVTGARGTFGPVLVRAPRAGARLAA